VPKEKLYVWFDAPIGYISSTKEWALRRKRLGTILERSRHKTGSFIGKDNMFFIVFFSSDVES
jgi:methionyl-tRNA synthetase